MNAHNLSERVSAYSTLQAQHELKANIFYLQFLSQGSSPTTRSPSPPRSWNPLPAWSPNTLSASGILLVLFKNIISAKTIKYILTVVDIAEIKLILKSNCTSVVKVQEPNS